MKRIVFPFMVLLVVLATACNNQSSNNNSSSGDDSREGRGNFNAEALVDRQMEELDEVLEFSGKQEKQMRELMMESYEVMGKMREEMQNGGGGFEGMREKMQEVRAEQNKKVKAVLSEEQWVKYEAFEKEKRSRRGQGRSGGQGRPE